MHEYKNYFMLKFELIFVVAIWVARYNVHMCTACFCGFAATEMFVSMSKTGYTESLRLGFYYLCQIRQIFVDLKDKSNCMLVFCLDKRWQS